MTLMRMFLLIIFFSTVFSETKFGCPTPRKFFKIASDVEIKCLSLTKKVTIDNFFIVYGMFKNFPSEQKFNIIANSFDMK